MDGTLQLQKHVFSTYLTLRYGIVAIGALLPLIVYGVGSVHGVPLQASISAYYWAPSGLADAPSRNWFVGCLFAVAAFLYLYKGFSKGENLALNTAAIFALGVAIFPMEWSCGTACGKYSVHGTCAVAMFLCLVYVVWFRSGDTLPLLQAHPKVEARYRSAYKLLGAVMLVSPITAFILNAAIGPHTSYVFFVESAGIWAFAGYWFTKSAELNRSMATARVLRGEVKAAPKSSSEEMLTHQAPAPVALAG